MFASLRIFVGLLLNNPFYSLPRNWLTYSTRLPFAGAVGLWSQASLSTGEAAAQVQRLVTEVIYIPSLYSAFPTQDRQEGRSHGSRKRNIPEETETVKLLRKKINN